MVSSKLKILYLEDNKYDVELVRALLLDSNLTFEMDDVKTKQDFTSALYDNSYDVIFADYTIPGYDGISALEHSKMVCPEIPFIFISGTMGEEFAIKTLTNGATDYILKQGISRLVPSLERALREAEGNRKKKKAEDILHRNEKRFRYFYENVPLSYNSLDINGNIIEVNQTWIELFGYSRKEIIGKTFLDIIDKESIAKFLNYFWELKEKDATGSVEVTMYTKSGSTIIVSIDGKVGYDEGGRTVLVHLVLHNITELKEAEYALRTSLNEKEVLLKEVHHRVKNNLQVISSLLNLQSERIEDEKVLSVFQKTRDRINAMQQVHQNLYSSDNFEKINFSEYVKSLTGKLYQIYDGTSRNINLEVRIDNVDLDINSGIPCGLIINELVTNAFKHGFQNSGGCVKVVMIKTEEEEDTVKLSVYNDGIDFPEDIDFVNTDSLGIQLVNTLVSQLNGEIELIKDKGVEFVIKFTP